MFDRKPFISSLLTLSKDEVLWGADTHLFYVVNGKGSLTKSYGTGLDGNTHAFLLANGIPLTKWHDDGYFCPTCEKLLSAGYGRDMLDRSTIERIETAGNVMNQPLRETIAHIEPFLHLLKTGLYGLAYIKLSPTNGDREFFWNLTNTQKNYRSSCDTFYYYRQMTAYPAFLVPTQPTTRYDQERVDTYRKLMREGASFGGLAYYLDGYLCALLDGHHRATAALLEEQDFYCVTILPATDFFMNQEGILSFLMGGDRFSGEEIPDDITAKINAGTGSHHLSTNLVETYLALEQEQNISLFPNEVHDIAKKSPDCIGLAAVHWAGYCSDDRIDKLFQQTEEDWEEDLDLVLKALITMKDPRAKDVALRIGGSESYLFLWHEAFQALASIQSEEIEDFFIRFLVYDEGVRPALTRIANEYLKNR
ncbi:hypothetical protein [Brevibacillus dissolubilis]|uniref:hypothetical protein n=1 Tax=Brevibacillus dissolubilis TaxID=1844116 RepID=UPI001115FABA|nr:hypothetical protein [Brevibacillus dissolubilis]